MAVYSRRLGTRVHSRYFPVPPTEESMEVDTRKTAHLLPLVLLSTECRSRRRLSRIPHRKQVVQIVTPYRTSHAETLYAYTDLRT